jgi:serine protease inhibitor
MTRTRLSALLLLLLWAFAAVNIVSSVTAEDSPNNIRNVAALSEQIWFLSERMYKEVSKTKKQFAISAVSIFTCLSMLLEGATNANEKELLNLLNLSEVTVDHRRQMLQSVMLHFNQIFSGMVYDDLTSGSPKESKILKTSIANSIWVDQGFSIKPSYHSALKTFYQSDSFNVDISDPKTVSLVNKWISEKTEGLIPKALQRIDRGVLMILANTVYFYARWMHSFESSSTRDDLFRLSTGREIKLPFMHKNNLRLKYLKAEDDSEYIELPYQTGRMSMVIRFGKHATEHANHNHVKKLLESTATTLVNLAMPKFDFKTEIDLKQVLEAMGLSKIFHGQHKGFERISQEDLFVSQAIHQSRIKVNEQGTEAAAVTIMMMNRSAIFRRVKPLMIKLDHPFTFMILELATGTPLFSGAYNGS